MRTRIGHLCKTECIIYDSQVLDLRKSKQAYIPKHPPLWPQDYMGMCATTLTKVLQEHEVSVICKLVGVDIGRLYLQLRWSPL